MRSTRSILAAGAFALAGCASTAPGTDAGRSAEARRDELACLLPSNCIDSLGSGSFVPLPYTGDPAQAAADLLATLAKFPEARIVRAEGLEIEAVFATAIGFRDEVEFRIDPPGQRIDYRSRSLLGLYDFGKNRSRMHEFATRFEQQSQR